MITRSTRRRFLAKTGLMLGAAALAPMLPEPIVRRLGGGLWLPTLHANPGTVLNPQDPSNFTKEGSQSFTPGNVLTLEDGSIFHRLLRQRWERRRGQRG